MMKEQRVGVPRPMAEYIDVVRAGNSEEICQKGMGSGARKLQEETLRGRDCGINGSSGRKGTNSEKKNKREDTLIENDGRKEWECIQVGELQQHHRCASSVSQWLKWSVGIFSQGY